MFQFLQYEDKQRRRVTYINLLTSGKLNIYLTDINRQAQESMKQYELEKSPIVYYISGKEKDEWVLFIHAAFVNRRMFQAQIDYFRDKYNVLTLDIIGHGKSTFW